jgi:hypothetical protein
VHVVGIIYWNIIAIHGPINIKCTYLCTSIYTSKHHIFVFLTLEMEGPINMKQINFKLALCADLGIPQ